MFLIKGGLLITPLGYCKSMGRSWQLPFFNYSIQGRCRAEPATVLDVKRRAKFGDGRRRVSREVGRILATMRDFDGPGRRNAN